MYSTIDAASVDGNTGSTWNYGSNFGGPTKSSWTSGADIVHDGMNEGMFGSFGIVVGQGGVTRKRIRNIITTVKSKKLGEVMMWSRIRTSFQKGC